MRKVEELERMLDIAKNNYRQLGGELAEDRRQYKQELENKRYFLCDIKANTNKQN